MNKIQGIIFDAYGALFDVHSIGHRAESIYPGSGVQISSLWRDKQIEYSRLVSLSDPAPDGSRHYQSFWNLTQAALIYTLQRLGLSCDRSIIAELMEQYARLDAFAECASVLEQLKKTDLPMVILSNGSPEMLRSAAANAGIISYFDHLISVDQIRQFKTHPQAYGLASKILNFPSGALLFVSSNSWDIMGASWYGFITCWINRANFPFETLGSQPAFHGHDLNVVLQSVNSNQN